MKVIDILNNTLANVTKNMHSTRKKSLFSCIESALSGASSTVTSIGRGIRSNAYEKHNIKRADRLLSNKNLNSDSITIYKSIAKTLIAPGSRPIILVDWSDLDPYKCNFLIRATLAMNGRGLTVYEEVHCIKHKEKPQTHKRFLQSLAKVIDASCEPVIVTDAGFKVPWFKQVQAVGWDFVGRTRLPNTYSLDGLNWPSIKSLYEKATTQPKSFSGFITKSNPLAVNLSLYKENLKAEKT
ncbi:IS4 family transposase [Thalassotalea psychrophila]|uniref:IS4 family transposase n=1 Tax=Thalassotalea psychrophila TaxID=3065647 RepID=A0ABY9TZ00_9GAMM|nr:IS4 family transposase [Colwelliaceae bacterium SQ149]